MSDQPLYAVVICADQFEGDAAPEWIRLMPLGDMTAVDGRKWRLDDPEAVIRASMAPGADLVVDFDHATDKGGPGPAAGWFGDLVVRDGWLMARVDWTARGREALAARDYRYVSPTFLADKSGRVLRILRAALVNAPALPQLGALAAAQPGDPDVTDLVQIAQAAGLAETAAADVIAARIAALTGEAGRVRQALQLAADADAGAVLAAISARPGADQYQQLASQLAELQGERKTEKVTAAVDAAIAAGKVTPAQRDWAMQYAGADLAGFGAFVAAAPVIVAPGEIKALAGAPKRGDTLDDVERKVCAAMRIDPAAFFKARAEEAA